METEPTFNGILDQETAILKACYEKVRDKVLVKLPTCAMTDGEFSLVCQLYITMTQENRKLRQIVKRV